MQTSIAFLAPLVAVAFAFNLNAAEKFTLRPHWEVGKVYKQENVTDMTMIMPGLGAAGEQKTNISQTLTVSVTKEPTGDNKAAEVKFAAIKGSMTMLGQVMTYDSTDPAKSQPLLQQAFGAMVGKTFTIVYDKDDKFVDVRGVDKLMPTPVGKAQGMDGKQMAEMFRKSMELGLPKVPVGVGDTWEFEEKMDMPPIGKLVIKAKAKFDSLNNAKGSREAKMVVTGELTTEGDSPVAKIGKGSTFEGFILFDVDKKVITTNQSTMALKLNVGGKDAPMNQKVTTTLVGVEDLK